MITKDWEILHSFDDFETFDKLSDTEKRIYYLVDNKNLPYRVFIKIYYKEDNLVIAYKQLSWVFMRNRFFIEANYKTLATVTPKRIYCDFCLNIMGAPFVRPFLFPLKFPLFVVNQGRRAHSIPTLIILPL